MNRLISCIGDTCKKMKEVGIKFVDSVDPNIQKKIEDDIAEGKVNEQNMKMLENKQEEIRNIIESYMIEMTVSNLRDILNKNPTISTKIKNVFTYYYTEILDLIPRETKENMTDTVDAIQNLDSSIELMYCIELMCNPDNYVMNYELYTQFAEYELEEEMKKCSITHTDNTTPSYKFEGERNPYTGITVHKEDPSLGIRKRMNAAKSGQMTRGGKKVVKKTRKVMKRKSKINKKTRVKKAHKSKGKKAKKAKKSKAKTLKK